VKIAQPFAVGRYAVTFAEWDACVADNGCNRRERNVFKVPGNEPVISVNWDDARAYAAWLYRKTGNTYRLLSEAEREYVARAGTTTAFWWGPLNPRDRPHFREANPWGLYVHGVSEWVEDCWHDTYAGAPSDGCAWTTACTDARQRVIRGGRSDEKLQFLRAAARSGTRSDYPYYAVSFRVARTVNP
jgi:formylglycine-generating enzyme required for sulfatase activity